MGRRAAGRQKNSGQSAWPDPPAPASIVPEIRLFWSGYAGLSPIHFDPQVDLRTNIIESRVAGRTLVLGGGRLKPHQCRAIQRTPEQPDLKLVQDVEGGAAALYRTPPAFRRVFHPLQRDQGVDSTDHSQRRRGTLRLGRGLLGNRKSARAGPARHRCRRGRCASVWSIDPHGESPWPKPVRRDLILRVAGYG